MRMGLYVFNKRLAPYPLCLLMTAALLIVCQSTGVARAEHTMKLSSAAFNQQAEIPVKYTCDGMNISPPLAWSEAPAGTKSLALICNDPDAPAGDWVHWIIYNIPAEANHLPETIPATESLADGAKQGRNDFRRFGYGGPCPPRGYGSHRYFFKLYALDSMLNLKGNRVDKKTILHAIKGHILAETKLMGTYERK